MSVLLFDFLLRDSQRLSHCVYLIVKRIPSGQLIQTPDFSEALFVCPVIAELESKLYALTVSAT